MKNLMKMVSTGNFAKFVFQNKKLDTTKRIDYNYKPLTSEETAKLKEKFKNTAIIDSLMQRENLNRKVIQKKEYKLDTIPVDYNYKKISKEEEDKLKKKIK